MGVFDSGIDPSLMGGSTKKASQTSHAGVFDSGIDTSLMGQPDTGAKAEVPTFDIPSPTAPKQPGAFAPDAASQFSSALSAGDFSVSGTPTAQPKKNSVDLVTRGYDTAPDKFKYKQTLSNTELARLDQTRPEHRNFGSQPIGNAEVKASSFPDIQNADTAITQDTTANTLGELGAQNFGELNPAKALSNTAGYAAQKWRGIRKEVLEPTVGKSLYETVQGVSMDGNFNETKKLDKVQRSLRGARAIADTIFSPLNVVASETSNPEDPSVYGGIGNVVNRFAALPFEAAYSTISTIGQSVGMEKETADDLGIVLATFAPMIKGMRERGATSQEISTVVDRANQTFTKIRDLSPEAKALYRQGAMELHPDVSGLPDAYMARFNDAAAKGDVSAMKSVLEEGRSVKTSDSKAYATTTEMRDAAKAGDENAIIRDSQFKEATKETALEVRNQAGKEVANVETVKYEDGTVAARVTVSIDQSNEVTTPFTEYPREAAAVKASAEEAARIAEANRSEYATEIQDKAAEVVSPSATKVDLETFTEPNAKILRQFQKLVEQVKSGDVPMKMNEYGDHPVAFTDPVYKALMDATGTIAHYAKGGWWHEEVTNAGGIEAIKKLLTNAYNPSWIETNGNKRAELAQAMLSIINGEKMPKAQRASKAAEQISKPAQTAPESGNAPKESNDQQISKPEAVLQENKKEVKSSEPNPTTNADRPESVPDAGKQESRTSGSGGSGADSGRARGERDAGSTESGAGSHDGGTGSAGKELAQTPKTRFGKTARAKLNAEVKAILEKQQYSTNALSYTDAEIDAMKEYSGAGGKIDKGAEGRGILDEFYTPREIVASMFDVADKYLGKPLSDAKILEPSAGVGRFVEAAPNAKNVTAYELDKVSGTILQILHPEAKVGVMDFQTLFIDKGGKALKPQVGYDLVIGNPPYGDRSGLFKGLGEESKVGRWEEYFIKRGLDLLNEDGLLVYIVPSSFLNSKNSKVKEAIESQGFLADAYRMPEGVFEDTQVGTDIIAIRKGIPDMPGELSDGKWFAKNPGKVLGTAIERKDRFGKNETAVTGSKEEAMKKLSEMVGKSDKPQPKAEQNKVEVFPITEWPLAGKVQAIVTEWPDKGKVGIGADESEARSKIGSKVSVAPEKKETKPRTVTKAAPEAKTVVDVSGIPTIESQTLNVGSATKQELEIFSAQEADGSLPASSLESHPDWAPYLNYEGGRYYHDVNYFSGDIRQRLDALERDKKNMDAAQYERQKSGLLSVLPPEKRIDEITFDPLDRFITKIETGKEKRVYKGYNSEYVPMTVEDAFVDWVHSIDRKLIGYGVMKGDIENFVRGNRQRANTKHITVHIKSESRRLFNQFMKDGLDAPTQKKIVDEFNRTKNSYVRPEYDSIPVVVKGMATEYHGKPFELSPTQRNGVGFLVNKGSGLVAYGVGVGKTHTLLIATKANMDKGWTKRPLFVVPASTLASWIDTTKRMFPGTKVNNLAGLQAPVVAKLKKSGEPSEWVKDGEISFVTHEGILRLGFDESELFDLTKDLNDALGTFDSKLTPRQLEQSKEKAQEILGQSLKGSTDILMRDLGIDHVSVDEVHNFRKVFQGAKVEEDADGNASQRRRFSNVTGGQPSARARKLFLVSQYVQKNNGGRNVFLASATPFENHATEVYNVLSFMARDRMRQMGIYNINDFYSTFANFQTETVQKTDGSWQEKEVMKSFSNLKQLQSLLQEFIDKKEERTLVRPDKVVIAPQLKMSPLQAEVKQKIREMIASDDDGVLLKATTYMKANSFSPYFVPEFAHAPADMYEFVKNSPKVEYAMEMLRTLKNDPATASRSNFVYVGSEGIGFTDMYVDYLVKEIGYKRSEVGVITGEVTDDQRESIKEKFNTGEIKVLIGGTPTKEGINLQMNGYATFNLSLGWNPTEMAQVEGRVWRQGNDLNKVLIVYPIVENSGDIGIYQKFEEKASRINDLFSYEGDVFDVGEIDPKEKKLLLLTDPTEKANLAIKLEEAQLQSRKLYLDSEISELEKAVSELRMAKSSAATYPETIARLKADLANRQEWTYMYDSVKRDIENYEKELKSAKDKVKRIEEKFAQREIADPAQEVASLKAQAEAVQKSITDSKLSFERLLEKYQNEYDQGILNTKSMEDHRAQIRNVTSTLRQRTPDELKAERARLVSEASKDANAESVLKEQIRKGIDPGDEGGLRVPSNVPRGAPEGAMASKGARGLAQFANRTVEQTGEQFRISSRVKEVIDKMETRFTKYVAPGSVGTFYKGSKNIALKSVNEVSVVHHELSHFVDNALGITESLLAPVGVTANGLPKYSAATYQIRKQLSQVYVDVYPGALKTDKLRIKVQEWYAALQQAYLEDPENVKKRYPELYARYIENAPELQKTLNEEMAAIVKDYQNLDAMGKMKSFMTRDINGDKDTKFLSIPERIMTEVANAIYPFEKLDKMAGNRGTDKSVSDMLHANGNVNMRIAKNLSEPGEGFWHFNAKGELAKVSDHNPASLVSELGKVRKTEEISAYLVARDQFENWNRLDEMQAQLDDMKAMIWPFSTKDEISAANALQEKVDSLKAVLETNSKMFDRETVTQVVNDNAQYFAEWEAQYDLFHKADLDALKYAGAISEEYHAELSQQKGYSPMKRLMEDGLIGDGAKIAASIKGTKVTKASAMKRRSGGTSDIIDPLVSSAANHQEIMRKAYKQFTMNRLYDTLSQFPEIAQEVPFKTVKEGNMIVHKLGNGKRLEDDPNVIVKMVDGKPRALAVREDFTEILNAVFTPTKRGGLEKFVIGFARRFSQGTTGAYPLYAATNTVRDQQTALVHTEHGYNPGAFPKYAGIVSSIMVKDKFEDAQYWKGVWPALKKVAEVLPGMESEEAKYVREYISLGGEYNTSLNFNSMTGEEILEAMARERSGIGMLADTFRYGLDLASLPSNVSEIATRAQEYAKARMSGKGQFAALEAAGRLTAPFHHKGKKVLENAFTRTAMQSVSYLNAAVQGLAQFASTASRDKAGFARAATATLVTAAVVVYVVNQMIAESDDKTKEAFAQLDTDSLGRYVFIPKGNGEFHRIPIVQEAGWLGALVAMLHADAKYGAHYSAREYVDGVTAWMPDQLKAWEPGKAILSIVPNMLKPSIDVIFNKTTYPTVHDLESFTQRQQLPQFRTTQNTSAFSKEFAQTAAGQAIGLSPIQLDHLIEGYFGRAIGYVTGKPSAYDIKSPFTQPEYFTSGRIIQKFYDTYWPDGTLEQTMNSAKKGLVQSTPEQDADNYAKSKRAKEVMDLLKDLRESEPNTPEFNKTREEIWQKVNDLMYGEFRRTDEEAAAFGKKNEDDAWKARKDALLSTYVNQFNSSTEFGKATKLENALKKEIIGTAKKSDPNYSALESRANAAIKAFRLERAGDDFIKEVQSMRTNSEKVAKFQSLKSSMTNEEYAAKIRDYHKKKLISDDLAKVLLKNR